MFTVGFIDPLNTNVIKKLNVCYALKHLPFRSQNKAKRTTEQED